MDRTERRGNKDFKKGGKLGQGAGALIRRGLEPLTNYVDEFMSSIVALSE